jgi:hypothetical protein
MRQAVVRTCCTDCYFGGGYLFVQSLRHEVGSDAAPFPDTKRWATRPREVYVAGKTEDGQYAWLQKSIVET